MPGKQEFSDSHGIGSCSPCNECGLRNVLQPCTTNRNRKCGNECPKGFFLNDNEDCQAEATRMPMGTKTIVDDDFANMTGVQLKTIQDYVTGYIPAKNSSAGEETPTPPSKNNTADDLNRNKDQESQTVNHKTFIVGVISQAVVIVVVVPALIFCLVNCLVKRSRTESAEFIRGEDYKLIFCAVKY